MDDAHALSSWSPTVIIIFNLVGVLVYAVFAGILAWKRKGGFRSKS